MEQRFLFYRIDIHRDHLAKDKAEQDAIPVFPHSTDASVALFYYAMVIA